MKKIRKGIITIIGTALICCVIWHNHARPSDLLWKVQGSFLAPISPLTEQKEAQNKYQIILERLRKNNPDIPPGLTRIGF